MVCQEGEVKEAACQEVLDVVKCAVCQVSRGLGGEGQGGRGAHANAHSAKRRATCAAG